MVINTLISLCSILNYLQNHLATVKLKLPSEYYSTHCLKVIVHVLVYFCLDFFLLYFHDPFSKLLFTSSCGISKNVKYIFRFMIMILFLYPYPLTLVGTINFNKSNLHTAILVYLIRNSFFNWSVMYFLQLILQNHKTNSVFKKTNCLRFCKFVSTNLLMNNIEFSF